MARVISRAEAWEKAHQVFTQVNFSAFDYNSIKESLLDYVKLYFPEDFNDYIESSEFIAILELFAYVGELLSYRIDLNAHENFITTAQRKESILRLAKLISYKASRNIPARGLVKMTSIQTTETVIDSAGRNLAGRRIYWNDSNNPDWKEQFLLVINRILEQEFGSVTPDERVQVNDVLFELYTLDNNPFGPGTAAVIPFTAEASGTSAPMEVVPSQLTDNGPIERRPEQNAKFSLVYANDGLGDGSDTTGFLMYVKQGTLTQRIDTFDGVTPNQTYEVNINNINETDLWLNNIDSTSGEILIDDPYAEIMPHLVSDDLRYGEWVEVDLANAQNIIFNTNKNRHKYEVETLDDDQIRIIFGDGEFSDVPSGTFQLWYRTSLNEDYVVEKSSIIDQSASISYTDAIGSVQTISFTFSLTTSLQNASASEDIEHIRRVAPSVYYTQDRMVNGRDYNTFMLQDPSILKLRSINRTFAGDSKYIAWHDPRENYEDVKLFGDDLAIFWMEEIPTMGNIQTIPSSTSVEVIIENVLEPLLSTTDFFAKIAPAREELGLPGAEIRTYFSNTPYSFGTDGSGQSNELDAISFALNNISAPIDLYYSVLYDEWTVGAHPTDPDSMWMITVDLSVTEWEVASLTKRLIVQSEQTKFWNTNTTERVINYDTINSQTDRIVVLQANSDAEGTGLLAENQNYTVLAQELTDNNSGSVPDIHRLSVMPEDVNGDNIPDNLLQPELFDATYSGTLAELMNLGLIVSVGSPATYRIDLSAVSKRINNSTTKGLDNDITVRVDGTPVTFSGSDLTPTNASELVIELIDIDPSVILAGSPEPYIEITVNDFAYLYREDNLSSWVPMADTDTNRVRYLSEDGTLALTDDNLYDRREGRYPLNFAWFHFTPRMNLVDPAASNIIDTYIITKGYYTSMTRWLENKTDVEPEAPLPLELRSAYSDLLDNKMISDTVVLHSGNFKILFGSRAIPQLRAVFKVVRPEVSSKTDNQVKVEIVNTIRAFFDIDAWEFGETFFFTELSASIHAALGPEIDSVVLVPSYSQNQFGDLFQIYSREDEIFIPDISTSDIQIIESITPDNIRQD
jgi:hypothetical protein